MTTDRREAVRAAWQRARWWQAAPWAAAALPIVGLGLWLGSSTTWVAGPALAMGLVAAHQVGGAAWRGALAGLWAGTLAAVVMAVQCVGGVCSTGECVQGCVLAGALAAVVLLPGLRTGDTRWSAVGVTMAALTAAVPCAAMGLTGLAVVPAVVAFTVPVGLGAKMLRAT